MEIYWLVDATRNFIKKRSWRVYLIKFNSTGDIDWEVTFAGEGGDDWAGEDICLTSDGGAVVAVDNSQFGFLKVSPV
jgi:hypothetical protein